MQYLRTPLPAWHVGVAAVFGEAPKTIREGASAPLNRCAREVQHLQDHSTQTEEGGAAAVPGTGQIHGERVLDQPRTRSHDDDRIAHEDGFIDVMGDE